MDLIKLNNLDSLINQKPGLVFSFFMPTYKAGTEVKQNSIRFKNLVNQAEEKLINIEKDEKKIRKILKPATDLIMDDAFWQHQQYGLALFLTDNEMYYYMLPTAPAEQVILSDYYYIRPLLGVFNENRIFYLLALSQHNMKLYRCSQHNISEIELQDVPVSIDEMLRYDDPEKSLQFHTGSGGEGKRPAVYHGQGAGSDDSRHKKDIQRFFQLFDKALGDNGIHSTMLTDKAGLILAGLEELIPLYREANSYPNLKAKSIDKNPEDISDSELRKKSWEIIKDEIDTEKRNMITRFLEMPDDRKKSVNAEEIIKGAAMQRVDVLFIDPDASVWGSYDRQKNKVDIQDQNEISNIELINFAVLETLRYKGNVIALRNKEMFGTNPMAAIFRYS